MSEQQQKVEGNGESALIENNYVVNAADNQHIHSTNLNHGTTNELQASHEEQQAAKALTAAEDSGHGTEDEEDVLNCRALVPFISQAARLDVPLLTITAPPTESAQQANAESTADHHTGDNYGSQQYNAPPPQAGNNVYGATVTFARVSEDDFKALNYDIFNYEAPRNQVMDGGRIVAAVVGDKAVLIHARVLVRSQVLYEIFNNGSEAAVTNRGVFPEIGLPEFKILMLAIYGINSPILGHQAYAGVDYVKALTLCNTFRCQAGVYDAIAECARGHFCAFKNWGGIPSNGLTQDLHRKQILDINEAHMAYKAHIRGDGPVAFTDNAFAILLWEFCPARVWCVYSYILDQDLVRQVSNAALRMRENIHPFSAQETKLFTRPSF
ncbi:hypothetical protein F4801DRAFT_575441 [Xylaria longipes]|nr:hypothetical protein F4801DRAFT_575441 [Xylaria longipes]